MVHTHPFYFYVAAVDQETLAAIESAGEQMVAAILPAFRRSPEWPQGVRAAIGALLNFLASRPSLAHLVLSQLRGDDDASAGKKPNLSEVK